jgi:hypothetical protein
MLKETGGERETCWLNSFANPEARLAQLQRMTVVSPGHVSMKIWPDGLLVVQV